MHVVMGGTGHVGAAVAAALHARGERVAIVTRDAAAAAGKCPRGVDILEADATDVASLRAAFRQGRRAFLLNPPADVAGDTDAVERGTVANILAALDGAGLEKVVAESVYGARPGERVGDLTVLWELEEGLRARSIPYGIIRGAYYLSNWDALLPVVRDTGTLPTMFPADFRLPMVAPADLGRAAADLLAAPLAETGVRHVEGPNRYSAADVADAFAEALERPVRVGTVPREEWAATFRKQGFSAAAADAYARMTAATVDGDADAPETPLRGAVSLREYIRALVARG